MRRGSQTLYKSLFHNLETPDEVLAAPQPTIKDRRNEAIVDYYYYHGNRETLVAGRPVRIEYSDLIDLVSCAFFLSAIRVHDIINERLDDIALIKQEWKNRPIEDLRRHLQAKWPMFIWD